MSRRPLAAVLRRFLVAGLVTVLGTSAALVAAPGAAHASIAPPPPPHRIYRDAEVVFVGRVESVGTSSMRVVVGEVLKGKPAAAVDVVSIYAPQCTPPMPGEKQDPVFKTGDRVLVAARETKDGYQILDHTLGSALIHRDGDRDGSEARALAFAREMLRIVALPDAQARGDAMLVHLSSEDASLVHAAAAYVYEEMNAPEKAAPFTTVLVAALDAPNSRGRIAAMTGLRGLTPPGAFDRLVALSASKDRDDVHPACITLGWYGREEAVDAIVEAGERAGTPAAFLVHLGPSPRVEAVARLRPALRSDDPETRKAALAAFQARIHRFGTTARDEDDLLAFLRDGIAPFETYPLAAPLKETRSLRVARSLVEVFRDDASTDPQRDAACNVLWSLAAEMKVDGALALLREDAPHFIARLDRAGQSMYLCWILGAIHTPEAKAALERARAKDPPGQCGDAWGTLQSWDAR